MLNGQIIFDYNAMMADQIGEYGLQPEQLEALQSPLQQVHQQIQNRSGKGADFLGFLDLPQVSEATLQEIQATADHIAHTSDMHVILGIGGSYLGARALFEALCHPYHNQLSREQRKGRPRIYFEGNNLDTDALQGLLDLLPTTQPTSLATTFSINVISKSGGTLETAAVFRLLRERAEQCYGEQASQHIVATTDASKGKLKALADKKGYKTFVIPDDVGGRYSVLTPVGLLPAAVMGINIQALVQGAKDMAALCQSDNLHQNPAYLYAALQYLSYTAGRGVSVMNIWDKALEYVGFWYDQLCAESVGKEEQGRIPLTGVCTRDLHSRGQELQEGPRNTVITNIALANSQQTLTLQADPENADDLNYLSGKSIHHMLNQAFEATNFAYASAGRPNMRFVLQERSAYTLGALFYLLEVATVAEGYLMDINPLDQPGVESYKNFMFGLLGREDKADYKARFEQRTTPKADYQL